MTFFTFNNVKFYSFSITNTAYNFLWIVLDYSRLVYKYVFFCVITVDETIAAFDVKPLDHTSYFHGYDRLLRHGLLLPFRPPLANLFRHLVVKTVAEL
jgi:hypothetical protein